MSGLTAEQQAKFKSKYAEWESGESFSPVSSEGYYAELAWNAALQAVMDGLSSKDTRHADVCDLINALTTPISP